MSGLAFLGLPGIAVAQPADKTYRIGVLALPGLKGGSQTWDALVSDLAKRGYVEGRNLGFEIRHSGTSGHDLEGLAAELAVLKVNLILAAAGTASVKAAMRATRTIPIVILSSAEPVLDGLVASLAHPGGNVTGNSIVGSDVIVKRLQLIAETVGTPKYIAYLARRASTSHAHYDLYQAALGAATRAVGAGLQTVLVDEIGDLEGAFDGMVRRHVQALVIDDDSRFLYNAEQIVALSVRRRIPAIAAFRRYADHGLLMTYGVDYKDLIHRTASYIDRILGGANPGDLPVEQASKFEMVVNLKAARALGIKVPRAVLQRADELIG